MFNQQLIYIFEKFGSKIGTAYDPEKRMKSFIGNQLSNLHFMIFKVKSPDFDAAGLESTIKHLLKDQRVNPISLASFCKENDLNYIPHTETFDMNLAALFLQITDICPQIELVKMNCPDTVAA